MHKLLSQNFLRACIPNILAGGIAASYDSSRNGCPAVLVASHLRGDLFNDARRLESRPTAQ
jgi:hypothetical protein